MAQRLKNQPLTAAFVRTVRRPGRHGDGRGGGGLVLRVHVTKNGRVSRTWLQFVRIAGRATNLSLGRYPDLSLAEARAVAMKNKRALAQGIDPRGGGVPTFEAAVEKVIELYAAGWKDGASTQAAWRSTLRTYAFPSLGAKRVSKVSTADVLAVLMPLWSTKRPTAVRVRNRISAVMQWAVAAGYRQDNPAGDAIAKALPRNAPRPKHHRALPHADVAAAIATVRLAGGMPATRLAMVFQILTATRPGEVREAQWSEMDFDSATWTIPPDRMKMGREHRVPLSPQAADVLREAEAISGGGRYVFPGRSGQALNTTAVAALLRRLPVAAVPHGFRSTFRDWCAETGVAREVAEASLAHAVKGVEASYFRSDLFERRRAVMDRWGEYAGTR